LGLIHPAISRVQALRLIGKAIAPAAEKKTSRTVQFDCPLLTVRTKEPGAATTVGRIPLICPGYPRY